MMTRNQALLWKIAEECAELSQRAAKAALFGTWEVQAGQELDNVQRLSIEADDVRAVMAMAQVAGILNKPSPKRIRAKITKVEMWMEYSIKQGQVEP